MTVKEMAMRLLAYTFEFPNDTFVGLNETGILEAITTDGEEILCNLDRVER